MTIPYKEQPLRQCMLCPWDECFPVRARKQFFFCFVFLLLFFENHYHVFGTVMAQVLLCSIFTLPPRIVSTHYLVSSLISEARLHHLVVWPQGKKQTISNALGETRGWSFPNGWFCCGVNMDITQWIKLAVLMNMSPLHSPCIGDKAKQRMCSLNIVYLYVQWQDYSLWYFWQRACSKVSWVTKGRREPFAYRVYTIWFCKDNLTLFIGMK